MNMFHFQPLSVKTFASVLFLEVTFQTIFCCKYKRDLYQEVYNILNRIYVTICTIIMRMMGSERHQWYLAKQSSSTIWKEILHDNKKNWSKERWCNKPTNLQFQSILKLDLNEKNNLQIYWRYKLISNQLTLFDSPRFGHSGFEFPSVKTCANKRMLLVEE